MLEETIKIPSERIAVLVGSHGTSKKMLETASKAKLGIDSATGTVNVSLKTGDAVSLEKVSNMVKAVGRGFNPDKAVLLMNDDYYFDLINLKEAVGKSEKAINQVKSRVIGRRGKMREQIESQTNCYVSVYGHTIGIIGRIGEIEMARKAIEMILEGANLITAQRFLSKKLQRSQEIDF